MNGDDMVTQTGRKKVEKIRAAVPIVESFSGYRKDLEIPDGLTDEMLDLAHRVLRDFSDYEEIWTDPAAILLFEIFRGGLQPILPVNEMPKLRAQIAQDKALKKL